MAYQRHSGVFTNTQAAQAKGQDKWVSSSVQTDGDAFSEDTVSLIQGDDSSEGYSANTIVDSSTNAYTATVSGTLTQQGSGLPNLRDDGKWGVYFDGSNDYLQLPANSNYVFGTADFTIEAWINTDGSDYFSIFQNCPFNTSAATDDYFFGVNGNGQLAFARHGGVAQVNTSNGAVGFNEWHHVAVTRTSSVMTLWLDGNSVATSTDTNLINYNINQNVAHTIGWRVTPNYGGGYLSNLRVINGTALYTSAFTPSTTPLEAVTNTVFLGLQSNRFIDNSTVSNSITASGTSIVSYSPFGFTTDYDIDTNGLGGLSFNGSSWFYVGTTSDFIFLHDGSSQRCKFWLRTPSLSASQEILHTNGYSQNTKRGWRMNLGTNGAFAGSYTAGIDAYRLDWSMTTTGVIKPDTWHEVEYKFDSTQSQGSYITITIDGVEYSCTEQTISGNSPSATPFNFSSSNHYYPLSIGILRNNGGSIYTGLIKDLVIYDDSVSTTVPELQINTGWEIFDTAGYHDLTGSASVSTSVYNVGDGSILFNGTSDSINISSTPALTFADKDFTIEFWIKTSSTNFNIINPDSSTGTGYWGLLVQSGNLRWNSAYNSTNLWELSASSITDNDWHHVAISRSSGSTKVFYDGTLQATETDTTNYTGVDGWNIGNGNVARFSGYLDGFRITRAARYTVNFTPATTPFVRTAIQTVEI